MASVYSIALCAGFFSAVDEYKHAGEDRAITRPARDRHGKLVRSNSSHENELKTCRQHLGVCLWCWWQVLTHGLMLLFVTFGISGIVLWYMGGDRSFDQDNTCPTDLTLRFLAVSLSAMFIIEDFRETWEIFL
jgi:hypothetical protein